MKHELLLIDIEPKSIVTSRLYFFFLSNTTRVRYLATAAETRKLFHRNFKLNDEILKLFNRQKIKEVNRNISNTLVIL